MNKEIKKVAILTAGGDCPGLNPVIRAVTKTAITKYGLEVMGVRHGYFGLYHGDFIKLGLEDVEDIFTRGGTILYSSNKDNLFQYPVKDENGKLVYEDASDVAVKNLEEAGIDALFILGGDGSLTSARDFARKGVKVVGIPKTIDNDLAHTDYTFGFDTAVTVATDGLDRVRTTGMSHHRVMVVEIMGRGAGWMTLHAGIAGAADAILIPEIPFDINKVAEKINNDKKNGKDFSIVAVAEGAKGIDGKQVEAMIAAATINPGDSGEVSHESRASKNKAKVEAAPVAAVEVPALKPEIAFGDFEKVDLRIGKVISCETVPKSSKLLKFELDAGVLGKRTIFSGIRGSYADPAALVGKEVLFVANLAPRKMSVGVSEGMILYAGEPGVNGGILEPLDSVPAGTPAT